MPKPRGVLLVTFAGDRTHPHEKDWYEEFFTAAGSGTWGLHDYWTDMSWGAWDLSGSRVFGWYDLNVSYTGSGANPAGRVDGVNAAKQAARDAGVAIDDYSVVVVTNDTIDLFGGPGGAFGGDNGSALGVSGLAPSLMGQEMGHVLGLNHSRELGSDADYEDEWDIMSTGPDSGFVASNPNPSMSQMTSQGRPVYGIGPGLNAANMWSLGWLDPARVWALEGEVNTKIVLRPLHRRDLDGHLAMRFDDFFIEFRFPEGWDASVQGPTVLVHLFENGCSHLVADSSGSCAWTVGSRSGIDGFPDPPAGLDFGVSRVQVEALDANALTATLSVTRTTGRGAPQYLPEWWPRRKSPFDLALLRPEDAVVITQGREVVVKGSSALANLMRSALLVDSLTDASVDSLADVAVALDNRQKPVL